jgi:ribosome assembly protein RRB1
MYFVAGTQADAVDNNRIYVMKASQLYRTKHDADEGDSEGECPLFTISFSSSIYLTLYSSSSSDSDADDNFDDDPLLDSRYIKHKGAVNRIRVSISFISFSVT